MEVFLTAGNCETQNGAIHEADKEYSEPLLKVVELHSFWSKERVNGNPRGYFGPRFLKTILKEKVCRLSEKSAGPMAS